MPKSFPSEKSAGSDDEKDLKAGPSVQNRLPDDRDDEEPAPGYTLHPIYPPPSYDQVDSTAQSVNTKQTFDSHPFSEDSKRPVRPPQDTRPTKAERLTLLSEAVNNYARAGERYDASLRASDQTSGPSRTASPSDSGSLWTKFARGPPLRTYDYSIGNLRILTSRGREKLATAVLGAKATPQDEMNMCERDLRFSIANFRSIVTRAEFKAMVEQATGDERWRSSMMYTWGEGMNPAGDAD